MNPQLPAYVFENYTHRQQLRPKPVKPLGLTVRKVKEIVPDNLIPNHRARGSAQ